MSMGSCAKNDTLALYIGSHHGHSWMLSPLSPICTGSEEKEEWRSTWHDQGPQSEERKDYQGADNQERKGSNSQECKGDEKFLKGRIKK